MSRERLVLGDRVVDLGWGTIQRGDVLERLSPSERQVIQILADRAGEVVDRAQLASGLGRDLADNALDRLMSRLRARLEPDRTRPRYLRTVRGTGYRLDLSTPAPPHEKRAAPVLIGRTVELAQLEALSDRLVVLVGPAGAGKTTLARALLARLDGWFVDLAAARSSGEVLAEVAATLGVQGGELVQVGAVLGSQDAPLVVLDNAEQCGDAVAELVDAWRGAAPRARFVATSRRPLGLPDERRVLVSTLALPDARALVCLRAAEVDPLTSLDEDVVERIVRRTDGLPLAIELATAHLDRLTPQELADRLDRSLAWLQDPTRDRPERHSTLFRAIAWSWDLLGEREQRALAGWSSFRSSFALADAEAVIPSPLDPLQHLVESSLIRIVPGPRFVLPDAVREYAEARLAERPDRDRLVAAWRGWCVAGAGGGSIRERMRNWMAAFEAGPDRPLAPELAALMLQASVVLPPQRRLALAELADRATGAVRVRLLIQRCKVRRYAGLPGYREDLDRALALATEHGDPRLIDDLRIERSRVREDDGDLAGAEEDLLATQPTVQTRYLLASLYAASLRPRSAERWFRWVLDQPSRAMALRARMQLAVIGSMTDPAATYRELMAIGAEVDPEEPGQSAILPFLLAWRSAVSWEMGELVRAAEESAAGVRDLRARGWIVPATELDAMAAMLEPTLEAAREHLAQIVSPEGAGAELVPLWRAMVESVWGDVAVGAEVSREVGSLPSARAGSKSALWLAVADAARQIRAGAGPEVLQALDRVEPGAEISLLRATPQLRVLARAVRALRAR